MQFFKKRVYLSLSCLTFNIVTVAASEVFSNLTDNIYKIQNTRYFFELSAPISSMDLDSKSRLTHLKYRDRKEEFKKTIRFIPIEDKSKEVLKFYIESVVRGGNTYLHREENAKVGFGFKPSNGPLEDFVWTLEIPNKLNNQIVRIRNKNNFLALVENEKREVAYTLVDIAGKGSDWRLHPFYPAAGYSDLYNILRDFGTLMEVKYNAILEYPEPKITRQNIHDPYYLSMQPTSKTVVKISMDEKNCREYQRVIFSSGDVVVSSTPSTYKFSRVIESENHIETSIQNTLTLGDNHTRSAIESHADRKSKSGTMEREISQQQAFTSSLHTTVEAMVSTATESSEESSSGSTSIKTTGSSTTHQETQEESQESGVSKSSTSGKEAHASAKGKVLGVKIGGELSTSSSTTEGSHESKSLKTAHSTTTATHEETTQQTQEARTKRQGHHEEKRTTHQEGRDEEKHKSHTERKAHQDTEGVETAQEQSNNESFSLEKIVGLNNIETSRKIEKESWIIEREIIQEANSVLQIKVVEKSVQISDYSFSVDMRVTGHVGFTFKDENFPFEIDYDPSRDFIVGSTWYISPATIIKQLPAPGYQLNDDGSVTYKVQAKLNLKKPVHLYSVITQTPLDKTE